MEVSVSAHAYNRAKERLGLNRNATGRLAEKAFVSGFDCSDISGQLCAYGQVKECVSGSAVRFYGENVWLYQSDKSQSGVVLVTVFPVPRELKRQALSAAKKTRYLN